MLQGEKELLENEREEVSSEILEERDSLKSTVIGLEGELNLHQSKIKRLEQDLATAKEQHNLELAEKTNSLREVKSQAESVIDMYKRE